MIIKLTAFKNKPLYHKYNWHILGGWGVQPHLKVNKTELKYSMIPTKLLGHYSSST